MALRKYHKHLTFASGAMPWATVQVLTLTDEAGNPDPGDKFKVAYNGTTSADIVIGTNATATDIRDILRALTGDAALTCSGTTDQGPFTVTFVNETPVDIISTSGVTGMTSVVVTVNPTGYLVPLKVTGGPYKIWRLITEDIATVGSPTYELTGTDTHPASTTELADESPADVKLSVPAFHDSVVFSGIGFQDTDELGITIYYETPGDRRF